MSTPVPPPTDDGAAPALAVERLSVHYGSAPALDEVSIEVAVGEVVAIIGPSGSGKSTLLRAVAGLEPPTAGTIRAGGVSLAGTPTHERDLGLMFQDHALFPHLDVAGNIAFGLEMQGWDASRRDGRVVELLDLVGLSGFGRRAVNELSGGEAQRVALARALAPEPALLMLDEPFGSLDRVLREQLTAEVGGLLRRLGQSALHVTHDQAEAFALADRVAVLDGGRVRQIGSPAELWERPRSVFVARFVGHANIWPISVVHSEGRGVIARLGSHELGPAPHLEPGTPTCVVPGAALTVDGGGSLPVVVERVAFDRGRYRVSGSVDSGGSGPVGVEFVTEEEHRVGDELAVVVEVDRLHPVADSTPSVDK